MQISCTPIESVGRKYYKQGVLNIAKAGFANVFMDMQMFCSVDQLENYGQDKVMRSCALLQDVKVMERVVEPILSCCRREGVQIPIARVPFLARDTKRVDLNIYIEELAMEAICQCNRMGCHYLIVRPLFAGISVNEEWQVNKAYYLRLAKLAVECDVILLLENQCKCVNGHLVRGICSDSMEAALWIDELNQELGKECFGFCFDVGVSNICGQNMHEMIRILGKRIKAVIIRDCNGNEECSQLPFTSVYHGQSQTDWRGLVRGLREIAFDGHLILDVQDTISAFSPLLRPSVLQLAFSVMQYFKWQIELEQSLKRYDKFVLFGAGNMCRNYMKCYGEQYPPLFTCDNNEKLWGTQFCGLEVKSPEALRDLPSDCVVLICNIYYQEIERQLRDMGIENIEYFNDEYLESFFLDRIEGRNE